MNFQGFDNPTQNWFKLPNEWVNLTSEISSLAELKVIEYVLRHTWGFQEFGIPKRITTDEFMNGRQGVDRQRIDKGTGLSNRSVIDGLRKAVEDGFLIEEINDADKGRIKKYYMLKMKADTDENLAMKNLHSGVQNLHSRGANSSYRTEKETLERHQEKKTVSVKNGILKKLRDLNQPIEKTKYVAGFILDQLGDRHSEKFYRLVAAKIPEQEIRRALSEIRGDGAREPARVFTYRMQRLAEQIAPG